MCDNNELLIKIMTGGAAAAAAAADSIVFLCFLFLLSQFPSLLLWF